MIFGKKTLFSLLLGIDLLANILEITKENFLFTANILSFCTYILLPGLLISLILRIQKVSLWENLLVIIGLSIAFLEFGGLLLNIILPLFGVKDPLAFHNILSGFDLYILFLFGIAWIRTKQFAIRVQFPKRSVLEKGLYILPVLFPVQATLGAIILNNGGSNILILILLGTIGFDCLLLVLFHNKIVLDIYPYSLFFMGLASLFTTSLRSWYITGHDIEKEFYVFQLTSTHHIWNMAFYQDAYNACLSITILPTVLTNLLVMQDMYIYKIIFQILFATAPILVFFIVNNYMRPIFAFLSAFIFMSFPTFFNDMPMLNRQEIGFIFFGLVIYIMIKRNRSQQFYTNFNVLSSSELSLTMRKILFIIFAFSIVVSHYSTNFVLLALVAFVYILNLITSRSFVKKIVALILSKSPLTLKNRFTNNIFLNLPLVLLLFGMTFFWNSFYTKSSNHTASVLTEVIGGLFVESNGAQSSDVSYSLFSKSKTDPKQQLQDYIQSVVQAEGGNDTGGGHTSQLYSQSITSKYPTNPIEQQQLAPTALGNLLTTLHLSVFDAQAELRSLSASLLQIFVFVGLLVIFFLKNKRPFDIQYLLLCFGAVFLLILETLLPALSVEYGILRMFQQFLFMLSLPIVFGISSILFFIKEEKRIIFTGIIAIIFFLNLTGFLSHLTGDYYPQMTLDNAGLYYVAYYVHKSDVLAIVWLSRNNSKDEPVEADLSGTNKVLNYGGIFALNEDFPQVIRKNAYVYQEISTSTIVAIDKNVLIFSSSKPFLDDNKNLIYSNGKDNVYK